MKYIKPYQLFEASASALTAEQISWLDKCVDGSWKLNSQTGLVDVNGDFDCGKQGLTDLKGVKFGKVSGDFDCRENQLTTLEGAPQTVGGDFDCDNNELTTLEGAPKKVAGSFSCDGNQLTTLEGAPQTVGWGFYCDGNQLKSLVGAPQTVGWVFNCRENQLTSLEGAPKSVDGGFYCYDNPVSETTLDAIFALMESGMGYQQALEEHWPEMGDEDKELMYKDHPSLTPEDVRKYKALATYNNIKGYL
jgi:hypothetical protein